jgi:pimeloyl-ACP methyl ester carboxylesterase
MRIISVFISTLFLLTFSALTAQDSKPLPEPQRVEITAEDGLTLVGDYYAVPDTAEPMPSVLLLHGITSNRHAWSGLIEPLLDNRFNVLTVDQRAHGETAGDRDLVAASGDVQFWFDWLRDQPSVAGDAISTIGASWGTVPAIIGCALDADCVTAIAISPGDFPLLDEALFAELSDRSVLFVVGREDNVLYDTQKLFDRTSGEVAFYVYNTGVHGTAFFDTRSSYRATATDLILHWLNDHLDRIEASTE